MKTRLFSIVILFLVTAGGLCADDGMWLPHQMKALDLNRQGLKMNPEDLYKPDGTGLMSAVVSLGGGTGEFVSPEGLILTNHHVAFGAIQRASDGNHDYINEGFYAASMEREIPAINYIADILLGYEEVTARIESALQPGMSPLQRREAIELTIKKIVRQRESKGKDLVCIVRDMYNGNQYYLFTFKRIKDVRLVYAPPQSVGNFGGEVDNWMWPRHTCDFTFLRAYVSKDNIGAEYSKANVPYHPKSFLKISLDGVKENDFTFIIGYPGRTFRNHSLAEVAASFNNLKKRLAQNIDLIRFFEAAGKKNRDSEIRYASRVKGLYNGKKNAKGKLEGLERIQLLQLVEQKERRFMSWAIADPRREAKYGAIAGAITKFMARYEQFNERQEAASSLIGPYSPTLVNIAYQIFRMAEERQKPDLQRDPGYQERDLPRLRQRLETAERGFDVEVDRAFFAFAIGRIFENYGDQAPIVLKASIPVYSDKAATEYADRFYAQTALKDVKKRVEMLSMSLPQLLKLKDPLIDLAAKMEKEMKTLRHEGKGLTQQLTDLKKLYEAGLLEMNGGRLAPDANGTIRFTCGSIMGYSPHDAIAYLPQTTLRGLIEKDTGKEPFAAPGPLKVLYHTRNLGKWRDNRLNDIALCFLNSTCVTGGNSGSPVLNALGEQVGIVFDMTYESLTGDYTIIPELQRSISVDIRYILFIADKFTGASRLFQEMGIKTD